MSRIQATALLLCFLVITPSSPAQDLRFIEPDEKTGSSKAVIVGEVPLIHTGQILPLDRGKIVGKAQPALQLDRVFRNLQEVVGDADRIAKLHFYLANEALMPKVQKAMAARFRGNTKPAVSFVVTPLAHSDALVAVDAVVAYKKTGIDFAAGGNTDYTLPASVGSATLPPGARLYISGQAEKGELLDATRKTLGGLRSTLKFLGVKLGDVVQVKAFFSPMNRAMDVHREISTFFGREVPPVILVEWHSTLPIEIELIVWGGREHAGEPIEFLTPPGMKASPVFSRVTRINYGKTIYISGQYGSSANDPAKEISQIFESMSSILEKSGSDFRHLAKANYYVTGDEATKKMGEIRPRFYDPKRPPAASLAKIAGTGHAERTATFDLVAVPSPYKNVNEVGEPEYGHGLTAKQAMDGWISLFDGKTALGWKDAKLMDGQLFGGSTTMSFTGAILEAEFLQRGVLRVGDQKHDSMGFKFLSVNRPSGCITVEAGAVKSLKFLPGGQDIFNGQNLDGWKRVDHPKLSEDRRPKWEVKDGFIHAQGGPGALEYTKEPFGDGVLQIEVRTRARIANSGLFFRCVPGQMMNGYEAQIYNRCAHGDVSKPSVWSTGAIDDRQNARRLVSRDGVPFVMTVIANGPHIATWVNGHQQVDWMDTRGKHENPRQGLQVAPGPVQLQAHDAGTDIEFRALRMAKWGK